MKTETPQTIRLEDYQPTPYLIDPLIWTFISNPRRRKCARC